MKPGISPNAFIGFCFLIMGIALTPSGGFSIGLPFLMMGLAFLLMSAMAAPPPNSGEDRPDA